MFFLLIENKITNVMISTCFSIFALTIIFQEICGRNLRYTVYMALPDVKSQNWTVDRHLKYGHIKNMCGGRESLCSANITSVCAVRMTRKAVEYKDYANTCYLFFSNMCDHPGKEYYIVSAENCTFYKSLRRNLKFVTDEVYDYRRSVTQAPTAKPKLTATTTMSLLYGIDTAYDEHICPMSCPDVYSPICLTANRGFGKYLKFLTFVNHCYGDIYYCKHFEEFAPPPDADEEDVSNSPLGWSFCGSSRYLQFARMSEVTSAMGHYGWLAGDYKYSHIMEPDQRMPGYGRK